MNRRTFASLAGLTGMLGALPPFAARATESLGLSGTPAEGWHCLDDCAAACGQRYRASGPASARLELIAVGPGQPGDQRQFTARFRTDTRLEEGVYLLRGRRSSMALFLQPVHDDPSAVQAVFNLA